MNEKISVLITVYKAEKFLDHCITSVFQQTYTNWELILVDNGSPDNCPQLCDQYALRDKRVKVVHLKNNVRVSGGRNACIESATGDYVTFLDSDDYLHPDCLRVLYMLCKTHDADMSQCGHVRGDSYDFPKVQKQIKSTVYSNRDIFIDEISNIVIWGKLYKKKLFNNVRFPIGKFYEDDRTTWKLYYNANKIATTTQLLYYYYENPESTMVNLTKAPSLDYIDAYEDRMDFFNSLHDKDMVDCTKLQICKSLVLTYSNKMLTRDQRNLIRNKFSFFVEGLFGSFIIKRKYKVLFMLFQIFPLFASKLANKLR